ncbi:hypothetical protein ES704_02790 [subsurface metagenome]|jgi:hypothetical protein
MKTEVVEQERVKKKEVAVGAGALILILLVAFAFAKKKKNEEPPPDQGVITPVVEIGELEATASPGLKGGSVTPGTRVQIQAQITNRSTKNTAYIDLPVKIRYSIYEGSQWMPTPGTLLWTFTAPATLKANSTEPHTSMHYTTVKTDEERRDVRVEVLYQDEVIAEEKIDTLFFVKEEAIKAAVEVLSISWL